jgi:hypothetical protein
MIDLISFELESQFLREYRVIKSLILYGVFYDLV